MFRIPRVVVPLLYMLLWSRQGSGAGAGEEIVLDSAFGTAAFKHEGVTLPGLSVRVKSRDGAKVGLFSP